MEAVRSSVRSWAIPPRLPLAVVSAGWLAILACLIAGLGLDHQLAAVGRADLAAPAALGLAFAVAILSASVVGSALALRRPRHPVGWLFLVFGFSLGATAAIDSAVVYGAVARPGALPAAALFAVVSDAAFVPWLILLGLIVLLTPSGRLDALPWRVAAWATVIGGGVAFVCILIRPYQGDYAYLGTIQNPLAVSRLAGLIAVVNPVAILVLHFGVLAGVVSLVVRYRAARDRERRQLRWLGWSAVPFACFVVGAYIASRLDNQAVLGLMAGGFVSIITVSAALAIEQYHLYDIERLVSRAVLWALLSAVLASCYAIVVVVAGGVVGTLGGGAQVPAVVATLATVSLLGPARRFLQDTLDRRFNRRRFDAIAMIRRYLREPSSNITVEHALREALGDATLTVAYWIEERACWVSTKGEPASSDPAALVFRRHDLPVCAITFDERRVERNIVEAVASEALTELENTRLRAAIALQLVEVRASRARIAAAQLAERRKIERNLHDGAQHRLLALALQLRAAEVNQSPERVRTAIGSAVDQAQLAIQDLRDLANGLLPATLSDGGLAAALDDLAARIPVPVRLSVTDRRYPLPVEETAWFITCEAVANAVKHAAPCSVAISAEHAGDRLRLVIEDDGEGGADPTGSGLRGIADRAEAIGGCLTVGERPGRGTIITAELPCAS